MEHDTQVWLFLSVWLYNTIGWKPTGVVLAHKQQIYLYRSTGHVGSNIWLQIPHSLQQDLVLKGSNLCKQSVFLETCICAEH